MSSYATQEDSVSLWFEQSTFVASHLAAVGYGIHVTVFSVVTYYILQQRKEQTKQSNERPYPWIRWLILNGMLFALGTINIACGIEYNGRAWITERSYPEGPFGYLLEQQTLPVMTLGNVASVLASFICDGVLLYRVWVLWSDSSRMMKYAVMTGPVAFYIACVVTSILTVVQIALPDSGMPPLSLAVWIILMILPMILTSMIVGRIWYHRQRLSKVLGHEHVKTYTGVAALVVESALPFTVLSIILLGLFGAEDIAQNLFVPLLVQVECIAPELIILRVIRGRALSKRALTTDNDGPISDLRFASSGPQNQGKTSTSGGQTTSTEYPNTAASLTSSSNVEEQNRIRDQEKSNLTSDMV